MYKHILASIIIAVMLAVVLGMHLSSAATMQEVGNTSVYIFGVTTQNGTTVGVPALLSLTITKGSGKVFLGSIPLTQTDTQAQAVVSAFAACELVNVNCDNYNFYYYIQSASPQVGGPSAGAAFAIAAMSILTNHSLKPGVAMTGTANPDGSVGLVGDVGPKSEAAADLGIKLFLYPAGEPASASDNITQQAINYDTAHGMATVAVSSVYSAYQYFTGYNITPTLNSNVTTQLYAALMKSTYQKFNTYQQSIYASLPTDNSTNSTVNRLISAALASIQQQNALVASGDYYTAASYVVNTSATDLVLAKTLEELSLQQNPVSYMKSLISAENASIQQTYYNITNNYVTNTSTQELRLIAIDRLTQGSTFLNNASALVDSNTLTAAYFYSLSEVKRASSLFWMSIVPMGKSSFSQTEYANLSQYYLYKASSYINYADLLNPSASSYSTSSEMQDFFSQAQAYQDSGQYIPSIFNSLESIATAELIIEENSIVVNGSVSIVTSQILTSALRAINTAEASNITPFLGISYYEFGKNFENSSLPMLIQYASYSRVYTSFESSLANLSSKVYPTQFSPLSSPLPFNLDYLLYLVLGVVLGFVVGGVVYEYKLFRMIQSRRLGKNVRIVVRKTPSKKPVRKTKPHRRNRGKKKR